MLSTIPLRLRKPITLGQHQKLFTVCIAELIRWAYEQGYEIACGDFFRGDGMGHKKNSNHYIKLAGDLNLFKAGVWQEKTEQHKELGEYWMTLHPLCKWGGLFGDGNHYSITFQGRM